MNAIQLEFNIKNENEVDFRISFMQKQIDEMNESMGKVRRKLFSEMGEIKKSYSDLHKENEEMKKILQKLRNQKTEWIYSKDEYLFQVVELKEAFG
jgi:hypothetical protein